MYDCAVALKFITKVAGVHECGLEKAQSAKDCAGGTATSKPCNHSFGVGTNSREALSTVIWSSKMKRD